MDDTMAACQAWTGPDATDPPGTWIPFSIRHPSDIALYKQAVGDPQINGCSSAAWMWWGITDDFDGEQHNAEPGVRQCSSGEGDWTDIWGNKVDMQERVDISYEGRDICETLTVTDINMYSDLLMDL